LSTLVLGAGLAGVAVAHYLHKAGEEVTVVERRPAAALETSFANGGLTTPSHSMPWAGPKTLRMLPKALGRDDGPVKLAKLDPKVLGWGLRFLASCTSKKAAENGRRMIRLASYSLNLLEELVREEPGLRFDRGERGVMHLFRDESALDGGNKLLKLLNELNVPARAIARDEIPQIEPALEPVAGAFRGGLYAPADRSGDACKFTQGLAELLEERGVRFRYNTAVERLEVAGERVSAVVLAGGERLRADRVVVALGSYAPGLLRPLGIRLPIYPVKGHAVTYRIDGANRAPSMGLMDEARKMSLARFGDRLRVVGMADIAGFDVTPNPGRIATLKREAVELFREVAETGEPETWAGLRPMTPDGPPILGRTKLENLFLNTGHGSLGWTMACGSGRIVADLALGRQPEHDLDGLTLARFG
jgi:D-amino-acid dehydrogenase